MSGSIGRRVTAVLGLSLVFSLTAVFSGGAEKADITPTVAAEAAAGGRQAALVGEDPRVPRPLRFGEEPASVQEVIETGITASAALPEASTSADTPSPPVLAAQPSRAVTTTTAAAAPPPPSPTTTTTIARSGGSTGPTPTTTTTTTTTTTLPPVAPVDGDIYYRSTQMSSPAPLAGAQIVEGSRITVTAVPQSDVASVRFSLNGSAPTVDRTEPYAMSEITVGAPGTTGTVRVDFLAADGQTMLGSVEATYQAMAAPPQGTTVVLGPAYKAELGLRPLGPGSNNGPRWATPFTAPRNGTIKSLAVRWVFAEGYYGGDGGHNQGNIYPDKNGQPDIAAGPIGSTVSFGDGNVPGYWNPATAINLQHYGNFNAPVKAGKKYWVVLKNVDGGGWTGIDSVTFGGTPPGINKASFVYLETGPRTNTFERFVYSGEPDGYIAQYELKYDDNSTFGQGYIHGGAKRFPGVLSGNAKARQFFAVNGTVTTSKLWVFIEKGSGTVTLNLNGQQATASGNGWLEFPIVTTLSPGTNSFELSSSGSHTMGVLWDGSGYGWGVGSRVDGYADYFDGSKWLNGWMIWGGPVKQGDMMFALVGVRHN